MDIIYQSMNMPRDSSLSTCKVSSIIELDSKLIFVLPSFKFSLWLFVQVRQSMGWKDFINVQKRSYMFTLMQRANQKTSMSFAQNLLD